MVFGADWDEPLTPEQLQGRAYTADELRLTAPAAAEHPCLDCGEPTENDHGRCRDCNIDYLLEVATCAACGTSLLDLKPIGLLYPDREAHGFTRACPWMAL